MQHLVRDLNALYRELPALHRLDCEPEGFEWLEGGDVQQSVMAYLRRDGEGREVFAICNFTPTPHPQYRLGISHAGSYRLCLNTDSGDYGGSHYPTHATLATEAVESHGRPQSVVISVPPLATIIYERLSA